MQTSTLRRVSTLLNNVLHGVLIIELRNIEIGFSITAEACYEKL